MRDFPELAVQNDARLEAKVMAIPVAPFTLAFVVPAKPETTAVQLPRENEE